MLIAILCAGKLRKALNYGVYSGVGITWASYEFCQYRKRQDAANMKRAVEVVKEAKIQKEAQAAEIEAHKAIAEPLAQQSKRSWYKFW